MPEEPQSEVQRLREAGHALSAALSRIDYLCGEPNEMGVSGYDVHMNEDAVVKNVETRLARAAEAEKDAATARAAALEEAAPLPPSELPSEPIILSGDGIGGMPDYLVDKADYDRLRAAAVARIKEMKGQIAHLVKQSEFWGGDALTALADKGAQEQARAESAERQLAKVREENERYAEKAEALHKFMSANKPDAVMAVITELRGMAIRRAALAPSGPRGNEQL